MLFDLKKTIKDELYDKPALEATIEAMATEDDVIDDAILDEVTPEDTEDTAAIDNAISKIPDDEEAELLDEDELEELIESCTFGIDDDDFDI